MRMDEPQKRWGDTRRGIRYSKAMEMLGPQQSQGMGSVMGWEENPQHQIED